MTPCSVEGCDRPRRGRQELCDVHRQHAAKGRPLVPIERRKGVTEQERFWRKVQTDGDCWIWTGAMSHGYGWFRSGDTTSAHRVAYQYLIGDIPGGLHLDHLCRRPACVNPYHLDPVPLAVNNQRAAQAQDRCKRDHLYDEANTAYDRHGYRYCRTCARERQRRRLGWADPTAQRQTHCPHGHEYTPENTYVNPRSGYRRCRACVQLRKATVP